MVLFLATPCLAVTVHLAWSESQLKKKASQEIHFDLVLDIKKITSKVGIVSLFLSQ